jgi:hypothetical protein
MNYKDQDQITLKSIKYMASRSEETHCYDAVVYFKGKKAGHVGNSGHGGCDDCHSVDTVVWDAMQRYVATTDAETSTFGGNEAHSLQPDLDWICAELVNQHLAMADMKKHLSKRVVFLREGVEGLRETKCARNARERDHWIKHYVDKNEDGMTILNTMPPAEAYKLWEANI